LKTNGKGIKNMKVKVYFANDKSVKHWKYISTVGMNDLLIIDDKRIRRMDTLKARIAKMVRDYNPSRMGKLYIVLTWDDDLRLAEGRV
jgi:hypothetical protein